MWLHIRSGPLAAMRLRVPSATNPVIPGSADLIPD